MAPTSACAALGNADRRSYEPLSLSSSTSSSERDADEAGSSDSERAPSSPTRCNEAGGRASPPEASLLCAPAAPTRITHCAASAALRGEGAYDDAAYEIGSYEDQRYEDQRDTTPFSPRPASVPRASAPVTSDETFAFDWNGEFQRIVALPDSYDKYQQLSALYRDFIYAAKTYGRIIISEKCVPVAQKTIQPAKAGGIAGGVKYVAQGILFKFAVDTSLSRDDGDAQWMYGLGQRRDDLAGADHGQIQRLVHD